MDPFFFLSDPAAIAEFFRTLVYATPWGVVLLFLFTLFANASIVLPILVEPVVLVVAAFAPNLETAIFIGVLTGTAAAIGEMSGYILGLFGANTLKKMSKVKTEKIFEVGEKLANKGMPIIFMGAFTPFPFDIIGLAAGIIKYDPKRFFIATWLGKLLRYVLVALVGFLGMEALPWLGTILGL